MRAAERAIEISVAAAVLLAVLFVVFTMYALPAVVFMFMFNQFF